MKRFRLVDNICGWVAFLIAAFVYCSTIEPTASFWDCPEFITTGYKLEIGHPPGAPFFMLTANLFSQFASDPTQVAKMVNTMSALLSATCILFLFWTISHLVRRLLISKWEDLNLAKLIAIEGSAMVGALIYTFSDTFWFSAVEGEVYAYSSAFTAVVFWLILKWEDHADEPHSDRWLVLIMYMTGLSIGVHLLNLLCVPAIVLVYYYRKFPNANLKGSLIALLVSVVLLAAVLYGVVPGIVTVGGWFELFFVNTLEMPFNTGLIIYIILLVATVVWAIYLTQTDKSEKLQNIAFTASVAMLGIPFVGFGWKAFFTGVVILVALWFVLRIKREKVALISTRVKNTTLLCMLMLMIGYSTYAVIVIRSTANPPMDQNSPEDIFTLGNYLSRTQYGKTPLLYGQAYTSQIKYKRNGDMLEPAIKKGAPIYNRKEKETPDEPDSYFVVRTDDDYEYAQNMLFPRIWDAAHAEAYESWMGGIEGRTVMYDRGDGNTMEVKMPTMIENLRFFLSYQCNFMYWRYFMWNFAGRQNQIQGNGELEHGNWITGIPFLDKMRLGDQSKLPDDLKNDKGHNVFYCLPLLLGIIGIIFQSMKKEKVGIQQFWVVFFLFFMTGLAIVLYLNQTPQQPRERDYAYAASFYAYAIWCGIGVAGIIEWLKRIKINNVVASALVTILCLLVPIQMASQTWDDHDRSGRYTCRDFGQNYLMSLQEKGNPIIFTNGDNDTFPLWYNQETEGVRTDARVCNLSYLATDWYIDQMKRPAYDSPSVPISWPRLDYCAGTNDYVLVRPELKEELRKFYRERPEDAKASFGEDPFELKNILKYWVRSRDMNYIPTDTVYITIDKEAVKKSGMRIVDESLIPDKMVISLKGKRALYKNNLMMLEILAESNWTRPVYVATTVGSDNYMNLGDNFVQEGLANRITPFYTKDNALLNFDTDAMYDNVMNKFKFGGLGDREVYVDETLMRMCYTHRRLMAELALHLCLEKKMDKAKKVLAYMDKVLPEMNVPADFYSGTADQVNALIMVGDKAKAKKLTEKMFNKSMQYAKWYTSLDNEQMKMSEREANTHMYILGVCVRLAHGIDEAFAKQLEEKYQDAVERYRAKGGQLG